MKRKAAEGAMIRKENHQKTGLIRSPPAGIYLDHVTITVKT
jgi:hypothetical protein